ncbi:hypothetical protein I4U23_022637 [Adineta vaga]|nr:hypothetical protein I4U23_022637 [Adineta vaga]
MIVETKLIKRIILSLSIDACLYPKIDLFSNFIDAIEDVFKDPYSKPRSFKLGDFSNDKASDLAILLERNPNIQVVFSNTNA